MTHAVHGLVEAPRAPEVPMPKRRFGTRVVLPLFVLGGAAGLLLWAARDALLPAHPVRAVQVVLGAGSAAAAAGAVAVQAPGWIEPDPHPVIVSALIEGTVAEVLALEGAPVRAGDVVARLVDADARLARDRALAELAERRAALAAAEAELAAAQTVAEERIERTLARDAARAALSEVEAQRARLEAEIAAAEARAAATRDELRRKEGLVERAAVAAGEVERLRLRLRADEADVAAAVAGRPVLAAKVAAAVAAERAATRAFELAIDETRALALAEAGRERARAAVALAEAALAEAELRLARTEVKAPADGVVLRRLVSPGSTLMPDGEHALHVVHLYDPRALQVRVEIPLADAAAVGVGQHAEIVVEALPDRVFAGRVSRLVHEADIARNTVQVKVAIEDPDPLLKPEMVARVRLLGSAPTAAGSASEGHHHRLLAPSAGVRREGGSASAWVVDAFVAEPGGGGRGRAARRTLRVAREHDGWVEVLEGLRPGDLVIVDGVVGLAEGTRVAVTEAP